MSWKTIPPNDGGNAVITLRRKVPWTLRARSVFAVTLLSTAVCVAADKTGTLPQRIDAEARQVLSGVQQTSFTHKPNIDAAKGTYATDASGFLDFVLIAVSEPHLKEIVLQTKEKRPLAQDYFTTFKAAPTTEAAALKANDGAGGWQRIVKIADARPGDVLAWTTTASTTRPSTTADTGHVMIIDEQPVEEPKQTQTKNEKVRGPKGKPEEKQVKVPGLDPHRMYRVVVIDCAATGHASDSRAAGKGGVGRGTLWVDIDAAGAAIAYHWSSATAKPKEEPIAIGRAVGKE